MLHQLPLTSHEEPSDLNAAFARSIEPLKKIMTKGYTDKSLIIKTFENKGFKYLANKPVEFKCGCSKEQMIDNVKKFAKTSDEDLFSPDKDCIEVVCEYCKTAYRITKKDIQGSTSDYH